MTTYKTLVFSGGGMKGLSLLGGLQYCIDNKMIDEVHTYIGTSIGAIIGYLLIIGYTPIEIFIYTCTNPIFKHEPVLDLISMMNGEGAISYTHFMDYLERMTFDKIGRVLTLKQLYDEFHKTLIVTTYNYTRNKLVYMSWETHPDIPCLTALRMTSTLPLLHSMYKYMNDYYIDGGVADNFPILYNLNTNDKEDISSRLGFTLDLLPFKEESTDEETTQESFNIVNFIYRLCIIPTIEEYKIKKEKATDVDIIELTCNVSAFEPIPNSTDKMEAFSRGYQQTKQFFEHTHSI